MACCTKHIILFNQENSTTPTHAVSCTCTGELFGPTLLRATCFDDFHGKNLCDWITTNLDWKVEKRLLGIDSDLFGKQNPVGSVLHKRPSTQGVPEEPHGTRER